MIGAAKSTAKKGKVDIKEVAKDGAIGAAGGSLVGLVVGLAGNTISKILTPSPKVDINNGYNTFSELKRNIPTPKKGNEIHHIVEQSQINKSGFDSRLIQNPDNVVEVSRSVHRKISGYYNSKPNDFVTNGLRVRDWLVGQSFEEQYNFGIKIIDIFKR